MCLLLNYEYDIIPTLLVIMYVCIISETAIFVLHTICYRCSNVHGGFYA